MDVDITSFITKDQITAFGGQLNAILILTQLTKELSRKIITENYIKHICFAWALLIQLTARFLLTGDSDTIAIKLLLAIINAGVMSFVAMKTAEAIKNKGNSNGVSKETTNADTKQDS